MVHSASVSWQVRRLLGCLAVVWSVFWIAGCEGFSTGDESSDLETTPGEFDRVTMGGIIFDNRNSDQLAARAWYGSDVTAGDYQGFLDRDGFQSVITWTREVLRSPGQEANDLPVQVYRTQIFDETGRVWRDYRQTLARSSDARVFLLEYREEFFDIERSYLGQPRFLYPSRDNASQGTVFTDGLGYRWRIESTNATSPNGYSNCRRLAPLSPQNNAAVEPGRVVQHTGDMYFHDDVGLVYVTEYDFSTTSVNIQPEPENAGFEFIADDDNDDDGGGSVPAVEVTISGVSFSSQKLR